MLTKRLQACLPTQETLLKNRWLRYLGPKIADPQLWSFACNSVASGASIGLFIAFLPFPGHMIIAALLAMILRANLPIAMLLVWVANPFTYVPMFGFAYYLGAKLMGNTMTNVIVPLLVGCLLCGGVLAILSNLSVRLYWRFKFAPR